MNQCPTRNIISTPHYSKSCSILDTNSLGFIQEWATTVLREQVPRNKLCYRSPNNKFEIWVAGIPNISANKGKSGGFRLVYFYVFHEDHEDLYLDFIEHRNKIGFKQERPKEKEKFEKHIRKLKNELLESLETTY